MKVGALVPIRLASERLPGKALKTICGRPVVHHLLDRIAGSRYIADRADIVVCTTMEPTDDPLVPAVEEFGSSVFRGSTDDIIRRFGDAMAKHAFDIVAQIDGDDPLSPTEYIDLTLARLIENPELDIVTTKGLPLGCNVKSFTRKAMDKVLATYRTTANDTGFGYFFTRTGICKHETIGPTSEADCHGTARLTLDYEADLELFRKIFEALYEESKVFAMSDVVSLLRRHPEFASINSDLDEEYWQRTADKVSLYYIDGTGVEREIRS